MINLFYDCYNVLNKVYSNNTFIKQALNDTFIEEKNRNAITKICYGVLDKDIELSYYISKLCDKNPKLVVRTILKIAMYNIKYLRKQPYAVVDNSVKLLTKLGKGGMKGFLNAVLRKFTTTQIELPKNKLQRLSIEYNYPIFVIEELLKTYKESEVLEIMSADTERTAVRFSNNVDGENYLKTNDYEFENTPFKNTFFVPNFKRNEDFDKGIYTFQSIGSVAICDIVEKGDNLLDCCSAPGGKSVNLSNKFKSVVSTDIHPHRVELIKQYIDRMNVTNVTPLVKDSTIFYQEFENKFDAILCDCPCSGLGVLKDNPDIKLNRTKEDIANLCKLQLEILSNVSKYLKSGGKLYYSTCSILNCENDQTVEKFLKLNSNFKVEKINSILPHKDTQFGNQFLPNLSFGAGFYCSKLVKD